MVEQVPPDVVVSRAVLDAGPRAYSEEELERCALFLLARLPALAPPLLRRTLSQERDE